MKTFFYFSALLLLVALQSPVAMYANENKGEANSPENMTQILILGLNDNVKSNYYYNGLISEETGIDAEDIDLTYNRIIAENIATFGTKEKCHFIPVCGERGKTENLINEIIVNGEGEESYADLSKVSTEKLQETLDEAGADYLLVINQHYLKWQETPLRTLFHIVSYSLFDKEKNEVYRGNNYFTSMNLEGPDKVKKLSRKSSSKIAAVVGKNIH